MLYDSPGINMIARYLNEGYHEDDPYFVKKDREAYERGLDRNGNGVTISYSNNNDAYVRKLEKRVAKLETKIENLKNPFCLDEKDRKIVKKAIKNGSYEVKSSNDKIVIEVSKNIKY